MCSDIILKIKNDFPNFELDPLVEDNPIAAINFLTSYVIHSFENQDLRERFANFINDLSQDDDIDIYSIINEMAIGLYDANLYNEDFKKYLSKISIRKFNDSIELWTKAQSDSKG